MQRRAHLALWALAAVAALAPANAAAAPGIAVRDYDLGVVSVPDPGARGPLPVRLWGAIGVPGGAGPHPLVVVAHGRHGDNCPPAPGESFEWPCFAREQRNDLGLRHVVAALAKRGVAAIAPDLNGAYTIGWGEPNDELRWPRIVRRTLAEVAADAGGGGSRFGVELGGRIDTARTGLLGHSRSGHNAVRLARRDDGVRSLFLLAPVHEGAALPDVPTLVVNSRCDADVPGEGRFYFERARRRGDRARPAFFIRLEGANHNYYNRTLARLGRDDGRFAGATRCRKRERLRPAAQQGWLARAAASFFDATLDAGPRPVWMRPGTAPRRRLFGLPVFFARDFNRGAAGSAALSPGRARP